MSDKTIVFGDKLSPEEAAIYKDKIARARDNALPKGSTPVGSVPKPQIPILTKQIESRRDGVAPRPPGSPLLSEETKHQLASLEPAMKAESNKPPEKSKEAKENTDLAALLDEFDFVSTHEAENILNNKERRLKVESRCKPIDIADLVSGKEEVHQEVIIVPGKFKVVYRTYSPRESLYIKQFLAKERSPNDLHYMERYSLCQLCCAIVSINDVELPSHIDTSTNCPSDVLFRVKLDVLMQKSAYVIADLGINYLWFDLRVRKVLLDGSLGNT